MMQHSKTYIIAEAGVNHNGNENIAFELLEKASEAGADCIKFQTFKSDLLCNKGVSLADYQTHNTKFKFQEEMLHALELPYKAHFRLKEEAKRRKIDFLSTPFDLVSLRFLIEELGLEKVKISSADLSNSLLLYEAASRGVNVIISTGMANLGDVEFALASLAWGYKKYKHPSSSSELMTILQESSTYDLLRKKVDILHCTSSYPADFNDINLSAMKTLKNAFNTRVGYSDHSLGIELPIAAVAIGAEIVEKHFTLDKKMEGPDHKASIDCYELKAMVNSIRNIEKALGVQIKYRLNVEKEVFGKVHKRILASKNILEGEKISLENIIMKRNDRGIFSSSVWDVINTAAKKDYKAGEPI